MHGDLKLVLNFLTLRDYIFVAFLVATDTGMLSTFTRLHDLSSFLHYFQLMTGDKIAKFDLLISSFGLNNVQIQTISELA